jgi:hypothetical protein
MLLDAASGGLMDGDGDFEPGMSCATIVQEKSCKSRGSNRKSYTLVGTNSFQDGVADISLSSTTSTVKEEDLSLIVMDRVHDGVICCSLFSVKGPCTMSDLEQKIKLIILELFLQQLVVIGLEKVPLLLRNGHGRIV